MKLGHYSVCGYMTAIIVLAFSSLLYFMSKYNVGPAWASRQCYDTGTKQSLCAHIRV